MQITPDLETLNKKILFSKSVDTPDSVYVIVPEVNPKTHLAKDQVRLETYVRLKSLPTDVMRLVLCITEARSIVDKVITVVPFLERPTPTHYPSGVVEIKWKLDNNGMFSIILHGFSFYLNEDETGFVVERKGKITWRFNAPNLNQQSGEFKDVDELIDFMGKCFVQT